MKLEVKTSPSFISSPFPGSIRKPEEVLSSGKTASIPVGTSIPQYIKAVYGISKVESVKENFPFLNRDDADKTYTPSDTDPFVFSGAHSIKIFKSEALRLLEHLSNAWTALNLPMAKDEVRNMMFPDIEKVMDSISKGESKFFSWSDKERMEDIGFLISNIEIMGKASLQRTVIPGWWAVSYDGKSSGNLSFFEPAIAVFLEAFKSITAHASFQSVFNDTLSGQGDPLDTTIGFPSYSAEVSKDGTPVSKLLMLDQYKNLPCSADSWNAVIDAVKARGRSDFERSYPFAIAPIRRIQPGGRKWAHAWRRSEVGLQLIADVRGHSTNRVAWMAPYLLNLLLSPVQTHWKALRKLIPGLYHDGETRKLDLAYLKSSGAFVIESDFSNYDRTIPVDVTNRFFRDYANMTNRPAYWHGALSQTQANIPLIWPDQVSGERGRGWVFTPKTLALLSGLKITSEVGTFMNMLIHLAGWLDSGYKTKGECLSYLTSRLNGYAPPEVLIQSDDTAIIDKDPSRLLAKVHAFELASKKAGIKTSVSIGDRFLMRHMYRGVDSPVSSRVWQNTLNNETNVTDPLIFLVGLVTRTDGMLGQKTFDPFDTGKIRSITTVHLDYEIAVLESLRQFISSSSHPIRPCIEYLDVLISSGSRMQKVEGGRWKMDSDVASELDVKRKRALAQLAARQLETTISDESGSLLDDLAAALMKNSSSPASQMLLDILKSQRPDLAKAVEHTARKEHQFYDFAMRKLGCPTTIDFGRLK